MNLRRLQLQVAALTAAAGLADPPVMPPVKACRRLAELCRTIADRADLNDDDDLAAHWYRRARALEAAADGGEAAALEALAKVRAGLAKARQSP